MISCRVSKTRLPLVRKLYTPRGGKLSVSVPRSVGQLPIFYNYKPTARRGYVDSTTEPLYPFGWGLSYTTFKYSNLNITSNTIGTQGQTTPRFFCLAISHNFSLLPFSNMHSGIGHITIYSSCLFIMLFILSSGHDRSQPRPRSSSTMIT